MTRSQNDTTIHVFIDVSVITKSSKIQLNVPALLDNLGAHRPVARKVCPSLPDCRIDIALSNNLILAAL